MEEVSAPMQIAPTQTALRRLAEAGPLAAQNLNMISLDAIKDSLGSRWEAKREVIWNQVERFLRHQFREDDLVVRLDDVTALIAQPGQSRFAAATRCTRVASDLLQFFLGVAVPVGVAVKMVESISQDMVVGSPLPPPQVNAALLGRDPKLWARYAAGPMPRLVRQGRDLDVKIDLAPLVALQAGRGDIGYAVEARVIDTTTGHALTHEDRVRLLSTDLSGLDIRVLKAAFAKRRDLTDPTAPLVIPVSQTTLTNSTLRYALQHEVAQMSPIERQSFAWEIVDLEPGAPAGRLLDLVATARPLCRGVICNLQPSAENARKLQRAGATFSVSLKAPMTESSLLNLQAALAPTLRIVPTLMLHKTPAGLLPVAAHLGATHCTVMKDPAKSASG